MRKPTKQYQLLAILLYGNLDRKGRQVEVRTGFLARRLKTTSDRILKEYLPALKILGAIESFNRPDWGKVQINLAVPNFLLTELCQCANITINGRSVPCQTN